jgi:hypothetical protein
MPKPGMLILPLALGVWASVFKCIKRFLSVFCADSRPCASTRIVSCAGYVAYKATHYDVALYFIDEITSHLSP